MCDMISQILSRSCSVAFKQTAMCPTVLWSERLDQWTAFLNLEPTLPTMELVPLSDTNNASGNDMVEPSYSNVKSSIVSF